MIINENYEMMGPSTSYMPQIDHMNPSGNSSSQINHQQGMIVPQVQQQPAKPKTTKKRPPPKKKTAGNFFLPYLLNLFDYFQLKRLIQLVQYSRK